MNDSEILHLEYSFKSENEDNDFHHAENIYKQKKCVLDKNRETILSNSIDTLYMEKSYLFCQLQQVNIWNGTMSLYMKIIYLNVNYVILQLNVKIRLCCILKHLMKNKMS